MSRDGDKALVPGAHPRGGATDVAQPPPRKAARPERAPDPRRADASSSLGSTLLTRDWRMMPVVFVVAFLGIGFADMAVPGTRSAAMIAGAVVTASLSSWARKFDKATRGPAWRPFLTMAAVVVLPMMLFGLAVISWATEASGADGLASLASLLIVSIIGTLFLTGKIPAVIGSHVGLWLGVAAGIGEIRLLLAVVLLAGFGTIYSLRDERLRKDRVLRQAELVRSQRRAEDLLREYERMGQGWFWETDRRGMVTYVSPTVAALLAKDCDALIGRSFTGMFILDERDQETERTLQFHLNARSSFRELAVRAACEGEERWWSISGQPVHDAFNNFVGFRGSGNDLTEKRRSQQNATRLAHFDSLTNLANRFQMSSALEKILNAQREDHRACAVFLLDLDRFKQVNDTMGHPVGDALLKQVAERLTTTVGDAGLVGRLGGDEFEVILPGRHQRDMLGQLAGAVIENLTHPYSIEGHRIVIGASIGVALSPDDGVTSEALIRNADLALYAAKDGGRGRFHFFDPGLHSEAEERRELEQDLRDAIATGGLELHYQPVVHTTTEQITGFEALLRWNHPTQGYLSPAKFIPIAEDAGLVAPLGEWALRTACRDLADWPDRVRVAVNVSPLQFANPALPAIVTSALAEAGVSPGRLELEITESVFLNDDKATESMFAALKGVGVRLALDDFGTGYSSLGYLKKAPFDKIKIDQSFVRGATMQGSRNGAIIASIVSLAEALNMETTAEGVETLDELDLVRELGCSHIQGYIYEKPLSHAAATERLAAGLHAVASGPRSARATRHRMLRKVMLDHGGQKYEGTIRNISASGAMIEGLWNVPPGTIFTIGLSAHLDVTATARWSKEDRIGVEFASALETDSDGRIVAEMDRRSGSRAPGNILRKAG